MKQQQQRLNTLNQRKERRSTEEKESATTVQF
jgi:hypothetical protein